MPGLRREEEWAKAMLEAELGTSVEQHDDGSQPSLYDLSIKYANRDDGAVEVTTATHPGETAFWNVMIGRNGRWVDASLVGGWRVYLSTPGPWKTITQDLPTFLKALETAGETAYTLGSAHHAFDPAATRLGVVKARQGATDYPGSIYPLPDVELDRSASFVDPTGKPLADWITDYTGSEKCADNRAKLAASGASERHLVLIVPLAADIPAAALMVLLEDQAPAASSVVGLPSEITDVWVASAWTSSSVGFRWSAAGWSTFAK
jgi:hypothetical protein